MGWDSLISMRPVGGYKLAMMDPPWKFKVRSAKGVTKKGAEGNYRVMSLTDIQEMPVREIMAEDSWLWLWVTNPMLDQGIETLKALGFQFTTAGHWSKKTKNGHLSFGTGYVLRCAGEPFLIGKMGEPKVAARNIRSVIEGPIRGHSRKPDQAFAAAARMAGEGAAKIEIFSREDRPGWDAWGDEAGLLNEGWII